MRVETTRFGVINVEDDDLFDFPMGILGFSRAQRFFVLDHREDSPFKWLQSTDEADLAFIISDPLYFKRDYHISVRERELNVIEPESADDLVVSVIMTVPSDPRHMTANLLAPVIFNMKNRKAMQYVLTTSKYPVKFFVMEEWQRNAGAPPPSRGDELRSISLR